MFSNQNEVLKNVLRPETVVALDNVSFVHRAQALPSVVEASESILEVCLAVHGQDEDIIDVRDAMRLSPDLEERSVVLERYVIAGGLVHDHDAGHLDPCEPGSANGLIFHSSSRFADRVEQQSYYEALGLDRDGNKDLRCSSIPDRLLQHVMQGIGNDLSVFTRLLHRLRATNREVSKASLINLIRWAIDQEGWAFALDYLADLLWGVPCWNRLEAKLQGELQSLADLFSEDVAEACWDKASAEGEVGHPLAIPLDIYEHGGVAYSVSGTGMNCRWDTSRVAAVWVPDDDAIDNIRSSVFTDLGVGKVAWFGALGSHSDPLHARFTIDGVTWVGEGQGWKWSEALDQLAKANARLIDNKTVRSLMYVKALEYCKGVLESYNDWRNGNVYGVVCYVIDRSTGRVLSDEEDECWGYLGFESAESELEALVLSKALEYGQSVH